MSVKKSVQIVKSELLKLGYIVQNFDESKLIIKHYKLPLGWMDNTTDLLLVVPDGDDAMHGISIPNTLKIIDGNNIPINQPNCYQDGWNLISFRLTPDFDNDDFVKNHMDSVWKKLSVM